MRRANQKIRSIKMEEIIKIDNNTINIKRTEESIEEVKKDFLLEEKQQIQTRLNEINLKLDLFV